MDTSTRALDSSILSAPSFPDVGYRPERDVFYRKEGGDIDPRWVWECEHMRHGNHTQDFSGVLVAKWAEEPLNGGALTCEVSAANLPVPQRVTFPIKVVCEPRDTEEEARRWLAV